jgi:hypothetical protein
MTEKVSDLIKKELGLEKGSGTPHLVKTGNLAIEQVIKIAKEKKDSMLVNSLKAAVKTVIGTCGTLGVLVEGKEPREINADIDNGMYDKEINEEKTDVSDEKKQRLAEELNRINAELAKEKQAIEVEEKPAEKKEEKKEEKAEEKKEEEKK